MSTPDRVIPALSARMPSVIRYAGAVATELRKHNVAVTGKESGNANTDALTLADLSLQAMLITAIRDCGPDATACRIEAEEETGPLDQFNQHSELVIALDPIDGTRQYRDNTANGWSIMLHVRTRNDVLYSLVFLPAYGEHGQWLEATPDYIKVCEDDPTRPAEVVIEEALPILAESRRGERGCYIIGFQNLDEPRAALITQAGMKGFGPQQMPSSVYPLLATGEFCGSLIHTPNIYDFPVSVQLARRFGGNAVRVDTGEEIDFHHTWMDEKSGMLRLHGIIALADNPDDLATLCDLAKDWNPERYSEGMEC